MVSFKLFTVLRLKDVFVITIILAFLLGLPSISIIIRLIERTPPNAAVPVMQMNHPSLQPEEQEHVHAEIGQSAPLFSLPDRTGHIYSLSGFTGPVVLYFWATWCSHCHAGLNDLESLLNEDEDLMLSIITINILEPIDRVESYVNDASIQLPILFDHEGTVSQTYNLKAVPTYVFIDSDGVISSIAVGQLRPGLLEGQIAAITKKPPLDSK